MKKINDILDAMQPVIINNFVFYHLLSFYQVLQSISEEQIEVFEIYLDPFYLKLNTQKKYDKIFEMYAYAFCIWFVDEDKYMAYEEGLTKEEKKRLRYFRVDLIRLKNTIPVKRLIQYIDYLLDPNVLKKEHEDYLGEFDYDKVYFEI